MADTVHKVIRYYKMADTVHNVIRYYKMAISTIHFYQYMIWSQVQLSAGSLHHIDVFVL